MSKSHFMTVLKARVAALPPDPTEEQLLDTAKACQPWLSKFSSQELAPLANAVNAYLATASSATNGEDLLVASKILEATELKPSSPIKNIYRGVYSGRADYEETISIPAVNMDKTVVNMLSNVTATSAATYEGKRKLGRVSNIYVRLSSPATLAVRNKVDVLKEDAYSDLYISTCHVDIHWEVIEYA